MKTARKSLIVLFFLFVGVAFAMATDKTSDELVAEANKVIKSIDVKDARKMIDAGQVSLIDCREQDEWDAERIPKAVFIPRGMLEFQIAAKVPQKDTPIIIYCRRGGRAALAAQTLQIMGYKTVYNLTGGITAWQAAKFPTEKGKQ